MGHPFCGLIEHAPGGRKAKASESLAYPLLETIQETQHYAERHGIRIELAPSENKGS
jgi:hypothetical protein